MVGIAAGVSAAGESSVADTGACIVRLVAFARAYGLIEPGDERWAYNTVCALVGFRGPDPLAAGHDLLRAGNPADRCTGAFAPGAPTAGFADGEPAVPSPDTLLHPLAREASRRGTLAGDPDDAAVFERFSAQVMGALMPRPAQVARGFERREAHGPRQATDWLYRLSCAADYVRGAAVARNLRWETPTPWGRLEITVNRAKPEKDPRAIAQAAAAPAPTAASTDGDGAAEASVYPACPLCWENEGYAGRGPQDAAGAWPPRQNLRIVPLLLGGEYWGLQYSPYAYFPEHCIVLSAAHRPMRIDRDACGRLLEFVERFPHYFLGANADLPVVGGSILSHDHFQGGCHTFPLMTAPCEPPVPWPDHPQVRLQAVRWPVSVLRLSAPPAYAEELLDAVEAVRACWDDYDDASAGIVSHADDGTRHNAITPICYRAGENLVFDVALRCNVTSAEHPLGVFHPHACWHHIKKENIGLIEVMGLAVLPGRLVPELDAVADVLCRAAGPQGAAALDALEADPLCAPHAAWARQVFARHDGAREDVRAVLRYEVGLVFSQVLEDAGVFKADFAGHVAQARFLHALGAGASAL